MTKFGMTLSSEEQDPRTLVRLGTEAEEAGFDFVSISDHYHPWIEAQGHSPFVWSTLGGIAQATSSIEVGTGVTCPTTRIHPAILAQATATTAQLLEGRFIWGVGSGETLNEHILGDRWPPPDIRLGMLSEAIDVVRELWTGEEVTHRGKYYTVEDARIFDTPPEPIPIVVAAAGADAASLAAEKGDGLWMSSPSEEPVKEFKESGGEGPIYAQIHICWADRKEEAVDTAHRVWPTTGVPGALNSELPTPDLFEQASSVVTPEMIEDKVPCGPDPEPVIAAIEEAIGMGCDHVYLHQIGPDQDGFIGFWENEVVPNLKS
ncbi:MAG: TIGR03557 family F420-dependent LLM class oxidoreductase [Acidimicrobiia bacterium]|nr:TIGR03557 family F420-dependent LLM class oxidoreductase [Acidimicrobiia bacterium]